MAPKSKQAAKKSAKKAVKPSPFAGGIAPALVEGIKEVAPLVAGAKVHRRVMVQVYDGVGMRKQSVQYDLTAEETLQLTVTDKLASGEVTDAAY